MNGLGSTFGVSMAAIFVEKQQAIHSILIAEDQNLYPLGTSEAMDAVQEPLYIDGERDLLSTKTLLVIRDAMLGEASALAYRDCYTAIALSSLLSLLLTLFLRIPKQPRRQVSGTRESG